jgi:hypothetical protein
MSMASIVKTVLDLYHRAFPETQLLNHEQLCLDAWENTLSSNARDILGLQLATSYYVQRQAMGAKVCFYYPDGKEMPLFANRDPDVHAATVTLRTDDGSNLQRMPVKIFVHRGRFFSIEFPKRPKRFLGQHSMNNRPLEVDKVEIHRHLD